MIRVLSLIICFFLCTSGLPVYARQAGQWLNMDYKPTLSAQEHYDQACEELSREHYKEALFHFMTINVHYPESPFYAEALFYAGLCYFKTHEYDLADKQFSHYLVLDSNLKHFDEIFEYKFAMAELYSQGKKRRLFGLESLPKWGPSKQVAIALYEEIIASLPSRELAAKSLYGKAKLHNQLKEYREALEALQTLGKQFPKHPLAADAYLFISEIYLQESRLEAQNPDLVGLAQINLQQFRKSFPSDDRLAIVETNLNTMQEMFAQSLYETGRFYERKKKPHASSIYYQDAIKKFPDSTAAKKSHSRLAAFDVLAQK